MSSTTSPSLLLKIRDANDSDSWDLFVDLYAPMVRTYCFQRRIQAADVDDIVQNVMSSVANAIRKFDYEPDRGRFRAWFGTIAANKIKNFLNKQALRIVENEDSAETNGETYTDPDNDWVDIFSERILRTACARIRGHFEEVTWKCFDATWLRNQSAADTAENLKIPIHNVYVNKSRVLKKLETEIKILAHDMPIDR